MVKNYLRLLVALVFATNLMAQKISCIKNDWFEQVACDKYGDVYVNNLSNNSGLKSLKNKITLTGRWAIKLDFKKNLIAKIEKSKCLSLIPKQTICYKI